MWTGQHQKLSSPSITQALAKLFNLILWSGDFPEAWSEGLITPIYKNGDKLDPSNYRGICVGSNLAKLFCNIINSRIVTFLTRHNILNKSQIGFLPKQRTSDHIYSLHTLINKNLKDKQRKIFTCFIDFKKAFDSIWHDGLLYKLLQIGIGGKTLDIIESMYKKSKCAVKIGNLRTEFFQQGRGVRQGCSLSPTLFNIYINELQKLWSAPTASQASLYTTLKSSACCMQTTWFCCLPQPRVSSTAWPCWNSTVRSGQNQGHGVSEEGQVSGKQISVQLRRRSPGAQQ